MAKRVASVDKKRCVACGVCENTCPLAAAKVYHGCYAVIEETVCVNKEKFGQLIHKEKPVLVDFWAPWCGYCRRIGAAYEKISEEYSDILVAGKVNIDEEPQIAEAEKIEVIPTLVLYRNGKAIDSIVAPESKIMIENFINEALEK